METLHSPMGSIALSRKTLVSFVRGLLGGYPDPDGPEPSGPWGPVVRSAWRDMADQLAALYPYDYSSYSPKRPKPNWQEQLQTSFGSVALNPQPLPPGPSEVVFAAALANQVIADTAFRYELLELLGSASGERGSERLNRFVDDFCGTGVTLIWPFPPPPPPWWKKELGAVELIAIGVQFERASGTAFSGGLREALSRAGARFIKTGLSLAE